MRFSECGPLGTVSPQARALIEKSVISPYRPVDLAEWAALSGVGEPGVISDAAKAALEDSDCMMTLVPICGAEHLLIKPSTIVGEGRIVVYLHGGAFTVTQPELLVPAFARIASLLGAPVLALRYPLAWQAAVPAERNMVVDVYSTLLHEFQPSGIALVGDSAGGGLAMSALLQMYKNGVPLPAVVGLLSPWVDISKTGHTFHVGGAGVDPTIDYDNTLAASASLYANGLDLRDPLVSPLYADLPSTLPPTFISTGTRDLLLSVCARLQRKLIDAGVVNALHLYEGMPHCFEDSLELPESQTLWSDLTNFIRCHWTSTSDPTK